MLFFFQDEKLKKLVELHGSEDWKLIASLLTVSHRSVGTHVHAHMVNTKAYRDREVNINKSDNTFILVTKTFLSHFCPRFY